MSATPVPAFKLNSEKTLDEVPASLIEMSCNRSLNLGAWQSASLTDIDVTFNKQYDSESIARVYENLLRQSAVQHLVSSNGQFWPFKLLKHILNSEAVLKIMKEIPEGMLLGPDGSRTSAQSTANEWTTVICNTEERSGFRRLLALLLLMEKEDLIVTFIEQDLSDSVLPVGRDRVKFPPPKQWRPKETDSFFAYQTGVAIPFFAPHPSNPKTPPFFEIGANVVRPWTRTSSSSATAQSLTIGGGYGEVHQVIIHPWQHDFHGILDNVSTEVSSTITDNVNL